MSESDSNIDGYPQLTGWRDLPQSGEMAVFQLADQLVGFTPIVEDEKTVGWGVTIGNPDYRGILVKTASTMSTDLGQEITYDYSFESKNPFQKVSPQFVTVSEFKQIFFGDCGEELPGT